MAAWESVCRGEYLWSSSNRNSRSDGGDDDDGGGGGDDGDKDDDEIELTSGSDSSAGLKGDTGGSEAEAREKSGRQRSRVLDSRTTHYSAWQQLVE